MEPGPRGRRGRPADPFKPQRRRSNAGGRGGGGWRRFWPPPRGVLIGLGVGAAVLAAVLLAGFVWVQQTYLQDIPELPPNEQLYAFNRAPSIKFYDRTGALIASRGPKYGDRVGLEDLPEHVPLAFLAAEDHRFYQHGAIDPIGIARALYINARAGRVVQGGSTISQQIAKTLFLTPEQTVDRKLQEMVLAQRLQSRLTKDQILELYLNRIYMGGNTFGIDGASRTYFGKAASQMSLSEAALLAALPKAPTRMALHRDITPALERSHLVLGRMRQEGWISREAYEAALADTPRILPDALSNDGPFGFALDYATNEAIRIAGPNSPDLMVRLTIDPHLQQYAGQTLATVIAADGVAAKATQAAIVSLGPDGAVRAMVGGTDYAGSVFNRAFQAKRQPGSTFKPFVYAAALEKGVLPSDVRVDGPIRLGDWRPENYGGGYAGAVTVETALARSINTVAVKLGQEAGGRHIGELSRRFGLTSIPANPDLSVTLGAYEVNLLELVAGFQVFQQAGVRRPAYIIEEIKTVAGAPVFSHTETAGAPAYDLPRASAMVNMMKKVVSGGTGTRARFGEWPIAGKTGTSQNWRDAWFVGFTTEYVTGVWVGNDDDTPMARVAGGTLPATIFRQFMIEAHKDLEPKDFEWLLPPPEYEMEPDPRNPFYAGLSGDFVRASEYAAAEAAAAEAAVRPPPPAPEDPTRAAPEEGIPY